MRKQAIQSATRARLNVNVKHQFQFKKGVCQVLYKQQELDSCYGFFIGVVACNGIICLYGITTTAIFTITLWNPSIRRKLNVPDVPFNVYRHFFGGFGYDPIADDYNILGLAPLKKTLYLYSTKKNAWSEIAFPEAPPFHVVSLGFFVDGKMHWLVRNKSPDTNDSYILTFDLSSQVFGTIPWHVFRTIRLQNTTCRAIDLRIFVSSSDSYVEKYDMDSYVETLALLDNESCWTKKRTNCNKFRYLVRKICNWF
ncbi:putative F-box protein At3g16210 [Rutidosis leptorrhynchoides]|uniref:putative F-box protein At3g16210 n=1 Tax=Rutidosis leptorrhynchoides TaxID=125765 RepID=UPI003A99B6E9